MRRGLEEGAPVLGHSMTPSLIHEIPRNTPRFLISQHPPQFPFGSGAMSADGDGKAVAAALHVPVLGRRAVELIDERPAGGGTSAALPRIRRT